MVKNKLLMILMMLLMAAGLYAQADNEEIEEESGEKAWQILEWEEEEPLFVLKYEVVIEELNTKTLEFEEINRLMTEDNIPSIQVQPFLMPGRYRYKVITYNLIGMAEVESDWYEFSIYQAFKPVVTNITVDINKSSTIYLDELNDGNFTVNGRNLFTGQEGPTDTSFTTYALERIDGKKKLVPEVTEHSDNNRHMQIHYDMKDLDIGKYHFVATDASGLRSDEEERNEIKIKFRKWCDFDVSAGYGCPVVLFDDTIEEYFGSKVWPVTAVAKMSLIPFKHTYGYLGLGIQASYTRMYNNTNSYDLDGNFMTALGNFIYQLPVYLHAKDSVRRRHILNLELHGGAGVSFFNNFVYHFPHNIDSEPMNSIDLTFDGGASVQIYITQRLFLEPNCDFIMAMAPDMVMGFVQPSISVGWQF